MDQRNAHGDLGSLLGQMFGIPMGGPSTQPGSDGAQGDGQHGGFGGFGGQDNRPQGPGIMEQIATWSKRAFIVLAVVGVVALAFCYWWFHPAINLHSTQVWGWIILVALARRGRAVDCGHTPRGQEEAAAPPYPHPGGRGRRRTPSSGSWPAPPSFPATPSATPRCSRPRTATLPRTSRRSTTARSRSSTRRAPCSWATAPWVRSPSM